AARPDTAAARSSAVSTWAQSRGCSWRRSVGGGWGGASSWGSGRGGGGWGGWEGAGGGRRRGARAGRRGRGGGARGGGRGAGRRGGERGGRWRACVAAARQARVLLDLRPRVDDRRGHGGRRG